MILNKLLRHLYYNGYDINAKSKKHVGQKNSYSEKSSNFEDKQYADIPKKTKLCSMITSTNYLV